MLCPHESCSRPEFVPLQGLLPSGESEDLGSLISAATKSTEIICLTTLGQTAFSMM